eukprot:scaffold51018_cov63-Phaeocystis_antarctica.AAC.1
MPQAARSFGKPRPISRLGRTGRPYWPRSRHHRRTAADTAGRTAACSSAAAPAAAPAAAAARTAAGTAADSSSVSCGARGEASTSIDRRWRDATPKFATLSNAGGGSTGHAGFTKGET